LHGRSGSRKSSLVAVFLSFFGDFNAQSLPMSFQDTITSVMDATFILKDSLACLDNFRPTDSYQIKTQTQLVRTVAHSIGDRTGRQRCDVKANRKPSKFPRSNLIVTGEMLPDLGEGDSGRMIITEMFQGDVSLPDLTDAQRRAESGVYANCMRDYIQWLKINFIDENYDEFLKNLKREFLDSRDKINKRLAQENLNVHARIPSSLAHLRIGYNFMMKYWESLDGNMSDYIKTKKLEFEETLIDLAREHVINSQEDKPTNKFITTLKALIESGNVYIRHLLDCMEENMRMSNAQHIGYEDHDFYYLQAENTFNAVARFLNSQGESFPLSKTAIWKQLYEEKYIVERGAETFTVPKLIFGKTKRLLKISKLKIFPEAEN
jgi:hypothetical protein